MPCPQKHVVTGDFIPLNHGDVDIQRAILAMTL
jgi:hypothetical protein